MKVIFIKDLKKQGKINDIKEVSDGYAVNYLIKNGYAVKYTKTSSDILSKDIKKKELANEANKKDALALKSQIENIVLEFKVSSNRGKMFGSVSNKQIEEELKKHSISIDKKSIISSDGLSTLGMHEVEIKLYKGIIAKLRVSLLEK